MVRKLSLYCFLFLFNFIYAQTEWASIGTEWYYCAPNETGNPQHSFNRYFVEKDTVVGGNNCRKIVNDKRFKILYEDSGKIYYWFQDRFHLMYDYTANIGDTVTFDFLTLKPPSYDFDTTYSVKSVIEMIDSINCENVCLKRYRSKLIIDTSLNLDVIWPSHYVYIESLGNEFEFINRLYGPSIDYQTTLRCYNNSNLNYVNPWWKQFNLPCDYKLPTSIRQHYLANNVNIVNPIKDKLKINNLPKSFSTIKLIIYNSLGEIVLNTESKSENIELCIAGIDKGLYFVSIQTEGYFITKKIIKK